MEKIYVDLTREAIEKSTMIGEVIDIRPFGSGHINDTFLVVCNDNKKENKYVLQRINHYIFKDVEKLMENYCNVCNYLKEIVLNRGGNTLRETITVLPTKEGTSFTKDSKGNYWRTILYIPNTITYDIINSPSDFYKVGKSFGEFQTMLVNYNASTLHESIPNFHNTKERFKTFLKSIDEDKAGRRENVKEEIDFILKRECDTAKLLDMLEEGKLPLRVTHNDTKLNNILMDKETKEGICIVDLDTIMPGLSAYDFGDAIRTGATYASEDEKDLSLVNLDLELFESFAKGFIEATKGTLTKVEIEMLPMGAKVITLEQGIRFLTDYLDGDLYYKTSYEDHNLVRTRTQLKLVKDMEDKWNNLVNIIKENVN